MGRSPDIHLFLFAATRLQRELAPESTAHIIVEIALPRFKTYTSARLSGNDGSC